MCVHVNVRSLVHDLHFDVCKTTLKPDDESCMLLLLFRLFSVVGVRCTFLFTAMARAMKAVKAKAMKAKAMKSGVLKQTQVMKKGRHMGRPAFKGAMRLRKMRARKLKVLKRKAFSTFCFGIDSIPYRGSCVRWLRSVCCFSWRVARATRHER